MVGNGGIRAGIANGVACAIALVFGSVGCDKPPPDPAQVTALHLTTSTSLTSNPPPAVDVTVSDVVAARNAYVLTLGLMDFPSGTFNCPFDSGIRYQLDFMNGPTIAVTVTANPGGCGDVHIPGTSERRTTGQYWADLAQSLGIDESVIYPYRAP
jgi:hypothetical protein